MRRPSSSSGPRMATRSVPRPCGCSVVKAANSIPVTPSSASPARVRGSSAATCSSFSASASLAVNVSIVPSSRPGSCQSQSGNGSDAPVMPLLLYDYGVVSGAAGAGGQGRGPGGGVGRVGWCGAADGVVARGDGRGVVFEGGHAAGVCLFWCVDGVGGGQVGGQRAAA